MRKTLICFVILVAATLRGDILMPIFFQRAGNVGGGWSITNQQTGGTAGPTTSYSMPAFSSPLTNGSIILLQTQNFTVLSTGVTITDTAGNTYTSLSKTQWNNGTADYFCASNTHTTPSNVITFAATTVSSLDMKAIELTNASGAISCGSNIDAQQGNGTSSSGSTTVPMGNFTTTHNGDFLWGMIQINSCSPLLPGASFATTSTLNDGFQMGEYFLQPTAANITVTASCSVTGVSYNAWSVAISP